MNEFEIYNFESKEEAMDYLITHLTWFYESFITYLEDYYKFTICTERPTWYK